MPRANLGALLGNVEDPVPTPALTPEVVPPVGVSAQPVESSPHQAAELTKLATPRPAPRSRIDSAPVEPAPYLRLVRKETRLREDQQNRLTLEARRLNRTKAPGTPRITDNTLIRVAVDLLLARISEARGDDEKAIHESLKP